MKGLSYKWIVAIVVIFGLFMVILDTTIVNIAIPRLQTTFGASLSDVGWVATGYTLAEGVGIPLTPFLSATLGTKRFYLFILASFTIGSMLCGLAWSLPALIAFRILQGIAGACMIPMSLTMLYTEFPPEERGVAMGALGIPIMLAPALGPTVGGYIVTYVSWQVLFYINVPVGIIGFMLGSMVLHEGPRQGGRYFDIPGFSCSSLGLASLLYAFSSASSDGWGSSTVLTFLVIGIAALAAFVIVELLTIKGGKQPLLDLRVFGTLSFAFGNIAMMMTVFALYGGLFLVPLYLQNLRGLSAYDAGLILLPQALGSMVATLIGGRLVDKLGVKAVVLPGLLILAVALWGFSHLTLDTPFATFQIFLVIRGFGLGLSMQPITLAALAEIKPAQLSQASTINSVVRSVTSALAVGLVATLVSGRTTFHYVRLAEMVTPNTAAGQALKQEAAYFASQGMSQANGMTAAIQMTVGEIQQQAYLLAMNDAFLLTLGVSLIAAFIVLVLVRSPRKKTGGTAQNKKPGEKTSIDSLGKEVEEEEPVFVH
ncbi:MAG TPA: DHA2 family efflux MFS transporter permease subunit [Ktedonobacteraceae bacterium]|nr:DHA2 family efflux MFS transporter permease subunit [Ktedonobacteraceae bacterium]